MNCMAMDILTLSISTVTDGAQRNGSVGVKLRKRGWHKSQRYTAKSGMGKPRPYKKPSPYRLRRQEGGVTLCDARGKEATPTRTEPKSPHANTGVWGTKRKTKSKPQSAG
jgi:hypothetical protein